MRIGSVMECWDVPHMMMLHADLTGSHVATMSLEPKMLNAIMYAATTRAPTTTGDHASKSILVWFVGAMFIVSIKHLKDKTKYHHDAKDG